jgi:hypothetical protein
VNAAGTPDSILGQISDYFLSGIDLTPDLTRALKPFPSPQSYVRTQPLPATCVVAGPAGVPFRSFLALNIAVEAARRAVKLVLVDGARKLVPGEFAPEAPGPGEAERFIGHFGLRLVVPPDGHDLPLDPGEVDLLVVHAPASPAEDAVRIARLGDTLVLPIGSDPMDAALICAFLDAVGKAGPVPTTYLVVVGVGSVREARETFSRAARAVRAVSGMRLLSAGFVVVDPALRASLARGRPLGVSAPDAASARSLRGVARLVVEDALHAERRSRDEWLT